MDSLISGRDNEGVTLAVALKLKGGGEDWLDIAQNAHY